MVYDEISDQCSECEKEAEEEQGVSTADNLFIRPIVGTGICILDGLWKTRGSEVLVRLEKSKGVVTVTRASFEAVMIAVNRTDFEMDFNEIGCLVSVLPRRLIVLRVDRMLKRWISWSGEAEVEIEGMILTKEPVVNVKQVDGYFSDGKWKDD